MTDQRELFEAAVVACAKEKSDVPEHEVLDWWLARNGDGYARAVTNAGWHFWNAARSAPQTTHDIVAAREERIRALEAENAHLRSVLTSIEMDGIRCPCGNTAWLSLAELDIALGAIVPGPSGSLERNADD